MAAGVTQTELAAKSGIPLATIQRIDSNPDSKVGLHQAVRLAPALGVEPMDLLPR